MCSPDAEMTPDDRLCVFRIYYPKRCRVVSVHSAAASGGDKVAPSPYDTPRSPRGNRDDATRWALDTFVDQRMGAIVGPKTVLRLLSSGQLHSSIEVNVASIFLSLRPEGRPVKLRLEVSKAPQPPKHPQRRKDIVSTLFSVPATDTGLSAWRETRHRDLSG